MWGTSINKGSNGVFTDIAHMMPNFWLMQQIYSGISSVFIVPYQYGYYMTYQLNFQKFYFLSYGYILPSCPAWFLGTSCDISTCKFDWSGLIICHVLGSLAFLSW